MRTAYFVAGIIVLILGIGLVLVALNWPRSPCTDDPTVAQDLGIPLCIDLIGQQAIIGVGGLAFSVTGIVLLTLVPEPR